MMMDQNNLSALSYKIKISGSTNLEMRCQSVSIPGVNLGTGQVATPFLIMQEPANFSYGSPLVITFMVGENLADYLEVYNWMTGLGQPDGFDRPLFQVELLHPAGFVEDWPPRLEDCHHHRESSCC